MHQRKERLTVYPHKIDAYESWRCCSNENGKHKHEEHIADREYNSMSLYNLFQLPILFPKAMRIREAKVAVDQEWNKLKIRQFGNNSKSETKKKSSRKHKKKATQFMLQRSWTLCHLKIPNWTINCRSTRGASYHVVIQWRMVQDPMQFSLNKVLLHRTWLLPMYLM